MKKRLTGGEKTMFQNVIRKDFPQIIVVFLAFALMVLVSYLFVSNIVEKQIFNNAREMLQTAETKVRSDFREAEVVLINTGLFVDRGLKSGWSAGELQSYLAWQNTALSPEETGVPGFFNIFCYIDGRFISARRNWDPPADYDPWTRSWFVAAEKAGGGIGYSSPYTDLITGEYILSLTKKMTGENGKEWYIGIDLNIEPLFRYVNGLHSSEDGYGVLIDENLTIMVHPNSDNLNRFISDLSAEHAGLARKLVENPREVVVQRMTNWKGSKMVLVSKELFNGWYLSIATPARRYYQDVYSMAMALSILGLGFMTVLSTFLIRLSVLKARSDEESREKSSFLARMSHEIRTPMNSILGMAEIIQRKSISSEVHEYISILHQAGQNLLGIINDILDFSRIESNRLNIEKRRYHIASVINDTINVIRPRAAEKSLDLLVNMDSAIPAELVGDDGRLRQILINLLSNAVKYTRKGYILLNVAKEVRPDKTFALIFSVRDSGIGIKPEDLGRLFDDFTRLDTQANQGIEGTGLGLVITRALCRAMGGDVTVTSEYGKGSVFKAYIVQEFESEKPAAFIKNPESKRVVFFDWRPRYIRSLADTFTNLGITAACSPDIEQFTRALEKGDYDYAFISSKHAMDCIYALGKRATPLELVIMVELGEVSVFREVSSILMPVYSVTLANVFDEHRNTESITSHNVKLKIRFTAPSAKILIVDDISTNLRVAKELMNPYNMNIHTCLSGAEAVDLVQQNRYDLIFMDHMMPGMDGIEATSRIRAMEYGEGYFRKLPIVALTANAVSGQREMFLQNGINDFLAKPIDIQKMNDILEKWLPAEKRLESSPAQEDTEPENAALPEGTPPEGGAIPADSIDGLDTESGLRNIGGSPEVYFDILSDFCRDAESRSVKISEALENGDTKLYITLVHALKGAARSVGAMETGEAAAWLEKTAENGDPAIIREKTAELLENLRVLADNIRNAEKQRENAEGRERKDLSALNLEALKAALAGMDIEAVNKLLLEYAGLPLDTETKAKIADLEQHILMFEYDKAIEKINELF